MVGVDYYNVQYEYLVKDVWGPPGIKYDAVDYIPRKSEIFGPRSGGRSLTFDIKRFEQETVVESSSVSLLVCFGVIAMGVEGKAPETPEGFRMLTQGLMRGARRVLQPGGRLIFHIEEANHRKTFVSNPGHFLGDALEVLGRPEERLIVIGKVDNRVPSRPSPM